MLKRLLPLLALSLLLPGAFAAEIPDYIRYKEDAQSARLEVAIKTFALPSGQKVDLIGVVHIADAAYYQELNKRFESYDSVLFELVGDPKSLARFAAMDEAQKQQQSGGSAIGFIQEAAGEYLDLAFQLNTIAYGKPNMVHADATAEEFATMMKERGESTLTLFARAMRLQLDAKANRTAMREFDTVGLIRILMSKDSTAAFKKALARMLDEMEYTTAVMEGSDGTAILSGRNAVAVKKVKEVLADKKQKRIAVFYGGAHMPGIEALVLGDLKAKAAGEEWLAAWTMPK